MVLGGFSGSDSRGEAEKHLLALKHRCVCPPLPPRTPLSAAAAKNLADAAVQRGSAVSPAVFWGDMRRIVESIDKSRGPPVPKRRKIGFAELSETTVSASSGWFDTGPRGSP